MIQYFVHMLSHTTIGANCSFGQNCVVCPEVIIGNAVLDFDTISIYKSIEVVNNAWETL